MTITKTQFNGAWIGIIVLLLIVQYIRPQELLGFGNLPLFAPLAAVALMFAAFSRYLMSTLAFSQIRLIALFFGWMILFVPFSQSPGAAVEGLRNFLPLFPFVISAVILINDVKTLHRFVDIFIVLTITIALIGVFTHGGGRYQLFILGNFLTDPNDYALFMDTMLPLCFFMFMYEQNSKIKKTFYGFGMLLALISIIMTYSRGGFLGLLCVSFVLWFFSPNRKVTATIGAILVVGVLFLSSNQWKEVVSTSFDTEQSTAQTRLTTWKLSLKTFLHHPMGIGMTNIPAVMYRYAEPSDTPERWWGDVNHSFWLTALAEGGIVGFLLIITLLVHNVRDCLIMSTLKETNDDTKFIKYFGYACLGSVVGFCSAGTFLTVNYYPHLWYISSLIAAGSGIVFHMEKQYENRSVY